MSLRIELDSSIITKERPQATLTISVSNLCDVNYILYGIGGQLRYPPVSSSFLCNANNTWTGGIVAIVYNEKQVQKFITTTYDGWEKPGRTTDEKKNGLITATVLLAKETKVFLPTVDLTDFRLEPGTYFLQIIYYSGKKRSLITESEIQLELIKHKSQLFQGCLVSNDVKFIVR
jgi:ribosomal protein L25 (general stress protein Ctc)